MAQDTNSEYPSAFINFMRSFPGRAIRVLAGVLIVYIGFFVVGGAAGVIVGVIGFAPIVAGLANFCLAGPLFHVDLYGHPRRRRAGHSPH